MSVRLEHAMISCAVCLRDHADVSVEVDVATCVVRYRCKEAGVHVLAGADERMIQRIIEFL